MTNENRAKLIKLLLIMKAHEAETNELHTDLYINVQRLECDFCDIAELSKAQDEYYALDSALSCMGEVIDNIGLALGLEDITPADFGREFISLSDTMPDEKQEVFVLFENGKICVSSWRYSKIKKRACFAYEYVYGKAVSWLPIEDGECK